MRFFYNTLVLIILFFIPLTVEGQICPPSGIVFSTQQQIDDFSINYPGCTEINGFVCIGDCSVPYNLTNITNLNGLSQLTKINGNLNIQYTQLTNLNGLENLMYIGGDLSIFRNNDLQNITDLVNLSTLIGRLYIHTNNSLTSLQGLNNITTVQGLDIFSQPNITSLSGLDGITHVNGNVFIGQNNDLTSLSGLQNLVSIGGYLNLKQLYAITSISALSSLQNIGGFLKIENCVPFLFNLNGLDNISQVGGYLDIRNSSITNLNALSNLLTINGTLRINNNPDLTDISGVGNIDPATVDGGTDPYDLYIFANTSLSDCALEVICNIVDDPNKTKFIDGNAAGCNSESEIQQSCLFLSPPECTSITYPQNGQQDVPENITITWNSVTAATGYQLIVGTTPMTGNIFNQNVGNVTQYNVSNLPPNTIVYATVIPFNQSGQASNCQEISFTTDEGFMPFITTWKTDNAGTSCTSCITIPTNSSTYTYNYDIDWENDGVFDDLGVTGDITHDYGVAGTYQVAIRGDFPHIYFNSLGDRQKILSIDQWGEIKWKSMENSFSYCINMNEFATDTPDLSNAYSVRSMFAGCQNLTGYINDWNVSTIEDFYGAFSSCYNFNNSLNNWDVSNAMDMTYMFLNCYKFNQNINNWDVSKVNSFSHMFNNANSFNQNLNAWNLSSATNLSYMFFRSNNFNGTIGNWNTSNVENMSGMFRSTGTFNQNINGWDVSNVISMFEMFAASSKFNQPLDNWNTSKVENMRNMFIYANSFNQDINSWDVGSVGSFQHMFAGSSPNSNPFNQSLKNWNLINAYNVLYMFSNSSLSLFNYDSTVKGWAQNPNTPNGLNLGATNLNYCFSKSDRDYLINTKGWTISGDIYSCPPLTSMQSDNCYSGNSNEISTAMGNTSDDIQVYDGNGNLICTINANGNNLGLVDVDVYLSSTDRSANIPYINRDISITPTNQPTTPVTVRIYYTASELAAIQSADPNVNGVQDLDFSKTSIACTGTYGGNGSLELQTASGDFGTSGDVYIETNVSSFSTFHASSQNLVLPVEYSSPLKAFIQKQDIHLNWSVINQVNNDHFTIEHITDALGFSSIGTVDGAGTTQQEMSYEFIHRDPPSGMNYYRLKQVDYDGAYSYSDVVSVIVDRDVNTKIYPNPFNSSFIIESKQSDNISLINNYGKLIMKEKIGGKTDLDLSNYPAGIYFLRFENSGNIKRLVKLNE